MRGFRVGDAVVGLRFCGGRVARVQERGLKKGY